MSLITNARDEIVRFAASLYERRATFGASVNINFQIEDSWLMTLTSRWWPEIRSPMPFTPRENLSRPRTLISCFTREIRYLTPENVEPHKK